MRRGTLQRGWDKVLEAARYPVSINCQPQGGGPSMLNVQVNHDSKMQCPLSRGNRRRCLFQQVRQVRFRKEQTIASGYNAAAQCHTHFRTIDIYDSICLMIDWCEE